MCITVVFTCGYTIVMIVTIKQLSVGCHAVYCNKTVHEFEINEGMHKSVIYNNFKRNLLQLSQFLAFFYLFYYFIYFIIFIIYKLFYLMLFRGFFIPYIVFKIICSRCFFLFLLSQLPNNISFCSTEN